ncbi:MAG: CARDB domain-containing protein [Planctomycetaceae bacterium]
MREQSAFGGVAVRREPDLRRRRGDGTWLSGGSLTYGGCENCGEHAGGAGEVGMVGEFFLWVERLAGRRGGRRRLALRRESLTELLEVRLVLSSVQVIAAEANVEFADMGYDSTTDEVGIVGYIVDNGIKTATVFELNPAHDAFVTNTLADLPGATGKALVAGISSDASRIAGLSVSPASIDGEGTTWSRTVPSNPTGIGFVSGFTNRSSAVGAWSGGVVGQSGGGACATKWNTSSLIQTLPGTKLGLAEGKDVSADGNVIVGFSTHEHFDGAAYFWDDEGIHALNSHVSGLNLYQSIAYAVSPDGNSIGGLIVSIDAITGDLYALAVVWDRVSGIQTILKDGRNDFFQGTVLDVTDSGFAVGTTVDGKGFIWHPSFPEPKIFEDWLTEQQADYAPAVVSKGVEAISEDATTGILRFALSDYENPGASYYVEVQLDAVPLPDLAATTFAVTDHAAADGTTSVTFTVANSGTAAAGSFQTQLVWSPNAIVGDADDIPLPDTVQIFSGLNAGTTETRSVTANIGRDALFSQAVSHNPAGQPVGSVVQPSGTLFLITDSLHQVPESNEANNSGLGLLTDSDTVTYVPWDTNGNGTVEPLEALAAIQAIGTSSAAHDFDGNGVVTPLEALSSIQRIGYQQPPAIPPAAPSAMVFAETAAVELPLQADSASVEPPSARPPAVIESSVIVANITPAGSPPKTAVAEVFVADEVAANVFVGEAVEQPVSAEPPQALTPPVTFASVELKPRRPAVRPVSDDRVEQLHLKEHGEHKEHEGSAPAAQPKPSTPRHWLHTISDTEAAE